MSKINTSFRVNIYDLPLNRFATIALPQYLQQLQQHQSNLHEYKSNRNWNKLRTEQLKGQQVAAQLEAALLELEGVAQQLTSDDEIEFEKRVRPYKNQALNAIRILKQNADNFNEGFEPLTSEEGQKKQLELIKETVLPEEIEVEQRKVQFETYQNLQKDIEELHDLFSEFSHQVNTQETTVSNIEENVEAALEDVKEGQQNLAKAARFKTTLYPFTGALIGTCIGGPIGLLAGLKIGGLAALGGTVLGFASGRGLKRWQESAVNESANSLTRSPSTPMNLGNSTQSGKLSCSVSFKED
ncbi:syntaxin-17-like [Daphnia carinata]|uniref:syntaxin-17-like n=1 Tax=Daphnia carinata TaxID=120202 RepID=UPI0025803331|nr:syntaxin-17-like [Daphnia carinata]